MYIYIYIYAYAFFFFGALHCSANTSPIVLRLGAANKPPCWQSLAPGPPLLGRSLPPVTHLSLLPQCLRPGVLFMHLWNQLPA